MMNNLEPRERTLVIIAGVMAVIFVGYFALRGSGPKPAREDLDNLKRARTEFFSQLEEFKSLEAGNQVIDGRLNATPQSYRTSSKTALIEEMNGYLNILGISYHGMSPSEGGGSEFYSEASLTIDIREVALSELVNLLKMIDSSPAFLRVTNLSLRRKHANLAEPSPLDVSMRVTVYTPKGEDSP